MKFLDLKRFAMSTAPLLRRDVSPAFGAEVNQLNHQPQETALYLVSQLRRDRSIIALKAPQNRRFK